jgi:hypothetical protein
MSKLFRYFSFIVIFLCEQVYAESSVDLRSIQDKFVELSIKEERLYISNAAQWEKFWRRFSKNPNPNKIDLSKYDIFIFLMGTKPSGGYSAQIESIEKKQLNIHADNTVHVLLCHPKAQESQLGEVTSPYGVKVAPKIYGKVLWKTRVQETGTGDCK